jgi:hypothetical protein
MHLLRRMKSEMVSNVIEAAQRSLEAQVLANLDLLYVAAYYRMRRHEGATHGRQEELLTANDAEVFFALLYHDTRCNPIYMSPDAEVCRFVRIVGEHQLQRRNDTVPQARYDVIANIDVVEVPYLACILHLCERRAPRASGLIAGCYRDEHLEISEHAISEDPCREMYE